MTRLQTVVLWLLVVAVVIGLVGGAKLYVQQSNFSTDLRNGLVRSCEKNANPLRGVVRHRIRREIQQSTSFDYSQFFPSVPPALLHRKIAKQIAQDQKDLTKSAPVDCRSLYPR